MLGLVFWLPYFYPLSHTLKFFWVFFLWQKAANRGLHCIFPETVSLCKSAPLESGTEKNCHCAWLV